MFPTLRARHGGLAAVIAGAALFGMVATTPAIAAPAGQHGPIVHQTPTVPITVDGVRYAPEQIHRFDGKPLYMRLAKDGKALIAYTKLARFKSYLRTQGIRLPAPATGTTRKTSAKASGRGHWTRFCTDRYLQGWCHTIDSGWGLANTRALDGCNIFGACWIYTNNIESMQGNGPGAVVYDWPNFDPGGGMFYLYWNETIELTPYGWANRIESLYQPW